VKRLLDKSAKHKIVDAIVKANEEMEDIVVDEKKGYDFRGKLIVLFGIILTIFHIYTAGFGILPGNIQMGIHWSLIGSVIVLARPLKLKDGRPLGLIGDFLDAATVAVIITVAIYQIFLHNRLFRRPAFYTTFDIALAVLAVLSALYLGFRVMGKIMPVVCLCFILYALFGNRIPGMFNVPSLSFKRIFTGLYTMGDGLFGSTLMVSARFLMLYIFFGNLMDISGAGQFFVNIADSFCGRVRGGPAQASIYSSMLMGMVSGSGPANVVTTGTFTIPLMKKTGYSPAVAGAVEACASSGGQIMPPVMGAAAFLMSETLGIPYSEIATAALLPACMYYFALSSTVYGNARVLGIEKIPKDKVPSLVGTLKKAWFHAIPLFTIIFLVFGGHSPQRAVFWALIACFAVTLIFNRKVITLGKLVAVCRKTAVSCGPMALACMLAGVIMCTINMTGLSLKVTAIIQSISGNSLLISLILAMLTSLLLGMGMPTTACYIVLAVLIAPTLIQLGVRSLAAHLFILYFGALSSLTPPVALSAYTASSISGAGLWETGYESLKMAITGFILPFVFIYNNELLLIGSPLSIVIAVITALTGSIILGLAVAGWLGIRLPLILRFFLALSAFLLYVANPIWVSCVGIALFLATVAVTWVFAKRRNAEKALPNAPSD
jgi:TRAP transporter 4TM/12TM fusion protein